MPSSSSQSLFQTSDRDSAWKDSVRAATTAAIANLSSVSVTMDGVTLVKGDRVLVKDNASIDGSEATHAKRNGVYEVGTVTTGNAPFTRAKDCDTAGSLIGAIVLVEQGTVNAGLSFQQTTDSITLETTAIVWSSLSSVSSVAGRTGAITLSNSDISGLGAAATLATGTSANNVLQLDSSAKIPAVDGSQITKITKSVSVEVVPDGENVLAASKYRLLIPSNLNGKELTRAAGVLLTAGTTGNTTIQVTRTRSGTTVNMLLIPITIAQGATTGTNGVPDTVTSVPATVDDVLTDDLLTITVTAVASGTAPTGLIVSLEFT